MDSRQKIAGMTEREPTAELPGRALSKRGPGGELAGGLAQFPAECITTRAGHVLIVKLPGLLGATG